MGAPKIEAGSLRKDYLRLKNRHCQNILFCKTFINPNNGKKGMNQSIIGIAGMALILFAFFMNQIGKWKTDFLVYDSFNFFGGALMASYALMIGSYPFLALNSVWAAVSLADIFQDLKKSRKSAKKRNSMHYKRK